MKPADIVKKRTNVRIGVGLGLKQPLFFSCPGSHGPLPRERAEKRLGVQARAESNKYRQNKKGAGGDVAYKLHFSIVFP